MLYLIATEKAYSFSNEPVIKMAIVAAAWTVAIIIGSDSSETSYSPQNPAISMAILTNAIIDEDHFHRHYGLSFMLMPYLGSIIGLLVYEFLHKPSIDKVRKYQGNDALDSEEEEEEANVKIN